MRSKSLRIIVLIFTFLLGFVSFSLYLIGQIIYVVNADNLDGYFNTWGMIFVILALIIVSTNIQSLIFHIQVISQTGVQHNSELLDETTPVTSNIAWLGKMPSKFLRNCNMIFVTTFLVNGLLILFHSLFILNKAELTSYLLVICLITIVCGLLFTIDAHILKKGVINSN